MSPDRERRSMSFSSECDDGMEESSITSTLSNFSPPRSVRNMFNSVHNTETSALGMGRIFNTPKSRRLFDDDELDGEDIITNTPYHRPVAKTRNANGGLCTVEKDTDFTNGRKRSSGRNKCFDAVQNMDISASDESEIAMYVSPRISPNSYITMDGRYVQSKNPFSSPMMEETQQQGTGYPSAEKSPPSLPVSFYCHSESRHLLPPRHNRHVQQSTFDRKSSTPIREGMFNLNGGYPDRRFSFTGSPIMETSLEASVLETGIATSGSLRKVRKLNLDDDIVSASSQNLFNRQLAKKEQEICSGNAKYKNQILQEHGFSPTDVMGFPTQKVHSSNHDPAPPPTPIKGRPNYGFYASGRRTSAGTPGPPLLERRRPGSSSSPGLGRYHNGSDDDDSAVGDGSRKLKSRFHSDFDIIGELGEGTFGKVYKVLSRLDGCMYAIKAAHRQAKGNSDRGRMLREVYALAALSDQADTANFHIVRYHQAWMEDDRLFIQTELCIGTLSDEVSKGGVVLEKRKYKLLREMLLALDFIHRNNMVHLDIKPDNIFIKNDQYKLGDFGLVTKLSASQDVEEGDSRYMSLELLSGDKSDLRKSDIFSLGATLYEICLGRNLPMNGEEWREIREDKLEPLLDTGEDMAAIIREMMNSVPTKRPTPLELLQHSQLLSEDQKALNAAKSKVAQANMQLVAQEHRFQNLAPPIARRGLTRANTWNGSTFSFY